MAQIPLISGQQAVRAFEKAGWEFRRQTGSHIILSKSGKAANLSIPNHSELAIGTLRRLIRDAGLTVSEFWNLL